MPRNKIYNESNINCFNRKNWPKVLLDNLEDKEKVIFLNRKKAVDMYLDDIEIDKITFETGITRNNIRMYVKRCLTLDDNGNVYGYTGLIPYKRVKKFTKKESTNNYIGSFSNLLDKYPEIEEYIKKTYFNLDKKIIGENNIHVCNLHSKFTKKCISLGIKENEYPFNTEDKGKRSLYRYINKLNNSHYNLYAKRNSDNAYQKITSTGIGKQNNPLTVKPFHQVQFDGHKIDIMIAIKFKTIEGDEIIKPLSRIWLLAIIDTATRVILGYHLCLGTEYSSSDVLKCIENSIVPKKKMSININGLKYPDNGGYASLYLPETKWALWDEFLYDNAKANLAKNVIEKLTLITNCSVNAGPVATPERRGIIERFFGILEERGYHRLINTTGNSINDSRRKNPEEKAIEYEITEDEIHELTEILIAEYNNTPHSGLSGFTPLNAMKQRIERGMIPRTLSPEQQENVSFLSLITTRNVVGSISHGRRPHINYEGVEYRSDTLAKNPALIGTKLSLIVNTEDLRTVTAFLPDGSEFGKLTAKGKWSVKPHTLNMRREINKLINAGRINANMHQDIIETYHNYLLNKAKDNKPSRNKLAVYNKTQEINTKKESIEDDKTSNLVNATNESVEEDKTSNIANSIPDSTDNDLDIIEKLKSNNIFKTFNL